MGTKYRYLPGREASIYTTIFYSHPHPHPQPSSKYIAIWVVHIFAHPAKIFSNSSATASPTSLVLALPPISPVRIPRSIMRRTASSTASASADRLREYWKSMAMDRMAATGFTMPRPDMSGAEPWSGEVRVSWAEKKWWKGIGDGKGGQ